MKASTAGNTGWVVPVDVVAFCVGTIDAERTGNFAGTTIDYSSLTAQNPQAFLGGNASRGLGNDALIPLGPGVHLHWALPDAITRATDSGQGLDFPAAPNRWLVTRLVLQGGAFTATSFVVASDQLNEHAPSPTAMRVPVKPAQAQAAGNAGLPDFHYLGQSWPLADYPQALTGRSLAEGTGFALSAVSNGVPSFASYYPESRNSFGLWDRLEGVPAGARLAYVVSGWYEGGVNDPVSHAAAANSSRAEWLGRNHNWTAAGDPEPAYTLYSGSVSEITWDSGRNYVPADPPPVTAAAALGNSPAEALAAFFTQALKLGTPEVEQLLTAFQQGLWPKLSQPQPAMLARLAEELHDNQFRTLEAQVAYTVFQSDREAEAIQLPQGIANQLDALNAAAALLFEAKTEVDAFRWRVFADWYRYFLTPPLNQAAVFTHLLQQLAPLWTPGGLQARLADAQADHDRQLSGLHDAIAARKDLSVRKVPGRRFFQANEPVLLLNAAELAKPARYGGDGNHRADGKLACRATGDIVSALKINGTSRASADFAAAAALGAAHLPHGADLSALIAEACLLNVDCAAAWSGAARNALEDGLSALLAGQQAGNPWQVTQGTPPSPVAITRWNDNPWLPIFLTWDVAFAPVADTGGGLTPYTPDFFTSRFQVDPGAGSFVSYGPGPGRIDPQAADYSGRYRGHTLLSGKPAENFRTLIEKLPPHTPDPTLAAILGQLDQGGFLVQPLAGFDHALLNMVALMQVAVVSPPQAGPAARTLTQFASSVLQTGRLPVVWDVTPEFDRPFNPIRAGFLQVGSPGFQLQAVDAFGQRRPVLLAPQPAIAASMAATGPAQQPAPGFAYAAPRLAQPARVAFQWLSAASGGTCEPGNHPSTSPICGWLLPNHLTQGFFLYDAAGRPLGSLFVGGDDTGARTRVVWQGAPGNDADIDLAIDADPVLAAADPRLRAVALQLGLNTSVTDFEAYYRCVDTACESVNPGDPASNSDLAVLIGRPVALVQARLRLELLGPPSLSQNSACLGAGGWTDTSAGLNEVDFPVALGKLDRLDDGLVGFFKQAGAGAYDLDTFYSDAAAASSGAVARPGPQTLLLNATPRLPDQAGHSPHEEQDVLMLVDPRAPVHAVTGILPTQELVIPADQASAAIGILEFSFAVMPLLRAAGGLALPLPSEPGLEVAYLEQRVQGDGRAWVTLPEIAAPVATAVWSYTPQSLTEGWLRFNPSVLTVALATAGGQPIAQGGAVQGLQLSIVNRAPTAITFQPGGPVAESHSPLGSIFYIHLGQLVDDADWPAIAFAAPGWTFTPYADPIYGSYVAVTCAQPVTLAALRDGGGAEATQASTITVALTGVKASASASQAHIAIDYYAVQGVNDGVARTSITINQPQHQVVTRRTS